ncbi:hypothetical protein PNA2_0958 [Pyrococcus sp. NA2]|uniref:HD domain-containing protein n=1 Tax=Pyrococcus sp. (strain NA2) TaxID=342949 RepID=UPI000209A925|nr:HD family hydrolase [Pyrococcus sp. NA2]AEC51874.1 hypothetical protein PNA2_0958 [Pyrococcus sp. NA2]
MLEKILLAQTLKRLPRMGWLIKGVQRPESIADHSFGVVFITLLLAEMLKEKRVRIDVERALKIAIVHDLAEAIITDVPISAQEFLDKDEAEERVFKSLFPEFYELYLEYRDGSSTEAQLVRLADKLDMILQAYQYELSGHRNLGEFWRALDEIEELEISKYFRDVINSVRRLRD